jgi:hypothetical protein
MHAMWVHGNAFVAQDVNQDVNNAEYTRITGARFGWGVTYSLAPNGDSLGPVHWFHVPLPTGVILDDQNLFIERVMVLFATSDAAMSDVHVWDGGTRIATFGNFQASERGGGEEGNFSVLRTDPGSLGGGVADVRPFTNAFNVRDGNGSRIHPRFGIGLSVGVHTTPSNGRQSTVTFFGAGVDLVPG